MFLVGILQALALTVLISVYNVFLRVAVQVWQIEPVVFTSVCLLVSAFILSICAGPGKLVKETLKSPATWLYSFVLISTYVVDVYVMHYISATEASFFSRLTIPLSIITAYILFKRKPKKTDLIGLSLVVGGLIWLVMLQPSAILVVVLFTVTLSAIFQTIQFVIAETHSEAVVASKTGTIRDKARVVGFVTFISSLVFLSIVFILSLLQTKIPSLNELSLGFIPQLSAFIHPQTVWAALLYGTIILPFVRYFKWSASYNLKAENLLVFMSFIPIVTLLLERLTSNFINIPSNNRMFSAEYEHKLVIIAVLITLGAGLTAFLRVRDEVVKYKGGSFKTALEKAFAPATTLAIQHCSNAMDDYEIVCATLEHTHNDIKQASKLLDISADSLQVLHGGKGSLALTSKVSQSVSRRFRKHVANRDALTGLLNRGGFMLEAKQLLEKSATASLLFIDLDKFKPVNDTYGHEAGDFILKGVADRLTALLTYGKSSKNSLSKASLVTRLGGDEFCIMLADSDNQHIDKYVKSIQKVISKSVKFKQVTISVGASVGIARYPTDAKNIEDLLDYADKIMYASKRKR